MPNRVSDGVFERKCDRRKVCALLKCSLHELHNERIFNRATKLVLLILLGLILAAGSGECQTPRQGVRVVVLVANNLSLNDVLNAGPCLRKLVSRNAVALMNTGLGKSTSPKYMAIGAGYRLDPPDGLPLFADADKMVNGQQAGKIFEAQTGQKAEDGAVVCTAFARLWRANQSRMTEARSFGLVGDVFHSNGLKTAVIGNSDVPGELIRGAPLIAMDRHGLVDFGAVADSVVMQDISSPTGCKDNIPVMLRLTTSLMDRSALIVLELGDFNRLESARYRMSDRAYMLYRQQLLNRMDRLAETLVTEVRKRNAVLIICSPKRSVEGRYKSNLSPILLCDRQERHGLLTSATTRCKGLISNIDVGPTIIRYAGLEVPPGILGQPANASSSADPIGHLKRMELVATRNYALQIPILGVVGAIALLVVTLSELSIRSKRSRRIHRRILSQLLLSLVCQPSAFLLIDGTGSDGIVWYILRLVAAVIGLMGLSTGLNRVLFGSSRVREYGSVGIALIATTVLLAVDLTLGTPLLRWSILSCDHVTGIRYYGIGNEYMGVMIGSTLIGPILLLSGIDRGMNQKRITTWLLVWFAMVSFVIGYPGLGAKVGGSITAISTFGVALIAASHARLDKRRIIMIIIGIVAALGVYAVLDLLSPAEKGSHLGRTVAFVRVYGWGYLFTLILGKLGMHLGILELRQTYIPMLASIPFLLMYRSRVHSEKNVSNVDMLHKVAMPATIVGMVVGFAFNDSGIVPASLMLTLLMVAMLFVRLKGVGHETTRP